MVLKRYCFLMLLFPVLALAQHPNWCGTDYLMQKQFAKNPQLQLQKKQSDELLRNKQATPSMQVYTIPIVFHVLHLGGPENITDAQVRNAVAILNSDFAKQNSDIVDVIPSFQSVADSVGVKFVLATRTPDGDCTTGIIHYQDTDTDWDVFSPTLYQYTWDPTRYLNVYVVRTIDLGNGFGAAGYTYFPGSFAPGDAMDAIVVLNNYFGAIGTGDAFLSRVLTHEVGHWLNLYHVFGSNGAGQDCFSDDYVNDTPPTAGFISCPTASDPSTYQLCQAGLDENYQNYMDYSYCCKMFTQGQAQRMRLCLQFTDGARDNLWSSLNLINTGITNPNTLCAPIADFSYDKSFTCVNTPVTFKDASWNGKPSAYAWTFVGGTPASSADSMPVVQYANPGMYSVSLTVSNAAGTSVPITKTNSIEVINTIATYQSGWTEGFEGSTLPNADWRLENSNGSANWETTVEASYTGVFSAKLDKTHNTRKAQTAMISPAIKLSTINNPALRFAMSTAESNPNHVNKLQVFISSDCEQTWQEIYNKSGQNLITSFSIDNPFVPLSQTEWREETILLNSFEQADRATFKFLYTRDTIGGANNLFVDDINISSYTQLNSHTMDDTFLIYPNPSSADVFIRIMNEQAFVMDIINNLGQKINSFTNHTSGSKKEIKINLPTGIYFVQYITSNKTQTKKLIITH
jgi:PKD repeat protein